MTQATFERVQLGVRLEKRMVKVLKALAEKADLTLAELMEDIIAHALEGECTFGAQDVPTIREFKRLYGMTYGVHDHYAHPQGVPGSAEPGGAGAQGEVGQGQEKPGRAAE